MLKSIKSWLGIEGVKIHITPIALKPNNVLEGIIILESKRNHDVLSLNIQYIEKYKRGRGSSKLINEYILGKITIQGPWSVIPDAQTLIPFQLPFEALKSKVDLASEKTILLKPITKLAKLLKGASSEFKLQVDANVKGVGMQPRQIVTLNG